MKYLIIIVLSCLTVSYAFGQKNIIDFDQLKSIDKNWEIIQDKPGRITYKSQKWLMYFVHWRELTDENKNISEEYANDLLKGLWGMPFVTTNVVGECIINGHQAYFAEAILRNRVRTRFIVWNCEETNRQFIADCNINISMKTPEDLFKLQYDEITSNFNCHQSGMETANSKLKQFVNYENLDISFNLPESWKSKEFLIARDTSKKIPGYYLNGVSKKEGTIWSLLTDSEKQIDLLWCESKEEVSKNTLDKFIKNIEKDTLVETIDSIKYISVYNNYNLGNLSQKENSIIGEGTFDIILNVPAYQHIDTTKYIQKSYLWKKQDKIYFLLASMVVIEDMWGLPFDLAPSDEIFNDFIKDIIKLKD
ncbi:hypothetical protein ACFLS4_04830 [Bacteroidota bacterium]